MDKYLQLTSFLDYDHADVKAFVQKIIQGLSDPREKAVKLFYAVRNDIRYNPYHIDLSVKGLRASTTLQKGFSWCVGKATLLTAVFRAVGIPAQLGFADVRNHQSSEHVTEVFRTNVYYWHGYSVVYLNGKWVKATPAFDLNICKRHNIIPVEFNGEEDAVFHYSDCLGRPHMEYLKSRGTFADLPLEQISETFRNEYKEDALKFFYQRMCLRKGKQQKQNNQ